MVYLETFFILHAKAVQIFVTVRTINEHIVSQLLKKTRSLRIPYLRAYRISNPNIFPKIYIHNPPKEVVTSKICILENNYIKYDMVRVIL